MSRATLDDRLAALREAASLGRDRIDDAALAEMDGVIERASARRALSGDHTVVGFFGATGSGKSSLFNAVVGEDLARVHVRRPTTSEPLAAVWNPVGSEPLLDWLQVTDRRQPRAPFAGDPTLSLILLDLPDFDSVELAHREIAERLAGQVDVLVWVVDPQKYADAVIHADFIRPFSTHAAVTGVVLNQIDLLQPGELPSVTASLDELLKRDGLSKVRILPASARTGEGIDDVRRVIAQFAKKRAAQSSRLEADLAAVARRVAPELASADERVRGQKQRTNDLVRQLSAAAGVEDVARAVGRSYAKRAGETTGWPLTAWLLRLRPDPLRRLHLLTSTKRAERRDGRDADLHRTALPPLSASQKAQAGRAVRDYADALAQGMPDGWHASLRRRANEAIDTLPTELDRAIARTDLGARGSWWWALIAIVQWIALLAALAGVGWYLAAWLLPTWGFPAPEITLVEGWPVPALLIAAGILLGILLGLASAAIGAGVGASRRARARRRLHREIEAVASRVVVEPLGAERDEAARFAALVRRAGGDAKPSKRGERPASGDPVHPERQPHAIER